MSFDLDGTAYAYPTIFQVLQQALQMQGHRVGILTGHDPRQMANDLAYLTALGFRPFDFYWGTNTVNNVLATNQAKANVIIQQAIACHWDDQAVDILTILRAQKYNQCVVFASIP